MDKNTLELQRTIEKIRDEIESDADSIRNRQQYLEEVYDSLINNIVKRVAKVYEKRDDLIFSEREEEKVEFGTLSDQIDDFKKGRYRTLFAD